MVKYTEVEQGNSQLNVNETELREDSQVGNLGNVIPRWNSQHLFFLGIHWLRISFNKKLLEQIKQFLSFLWGEPDDFDWGHYNYNRRFGWMSGVSLNYDVGDDRDFHKGRITMDCPGSALDELSPEDLQVLIEFCWRIDGKCRRIDPYFDDYEKIISPHDLVGVIENHDYSGPRKARLLPEYESGVRVGDEVTFGVRGCRGSGQYVRFYDKSMESKGEQDCYRWELEFLGDKAHNAFLMLAATNGDLDAFARVCGGMIAGCIRFIDRTGDKNVSRMKVLAWWKRICDIVGDGVPVRVERVVDRVIGKLDYLEKYVSTSLAFARRIFVDDDVYKRWIFDRCRDGDARMKPALLQLAEEHERSIDYANHKILTNTGMPYEC